MYFCEESNLGYYEVVHGSTQVRRNRCCVRIKIGNIVKNCFNVILILLGKKNCNTAAPIASYKLNFLCVLIILPIKENEHLY